MERERELRTNPECCFEFGPERGVAEAKECVVEGLAVGVVVGGVFERSESGLDVFCRW